MRAVLIIFAAAAVVRFGQTTAKKASPTWITVRPEFENRRSPLAKARRTYSIGLMPWHTPLLKYPGRQFAGVVYHLRSCIISV